MADGKVVYEGTVEPNQTLSWKGSDRIAVTAGNAGAVDIIYNGRSLGRLGKDGDVVKKPNGPKSIKISCFLTDKTTPLTVSPAVICLIFSPACASRSSIVIAAFAISLLKTPSLN